MGDETLKRCPFCANAPQLDAVRGVTEKWWVECLDCSGGGPSLPSEREAVRAWNDVSTATARAVAAEQRAEALEREVARLRAVIGYEAAKLPAPAQIVGVLTCRRVAEQVREALLDSLAQPAGEVSDG